MGDTSQVVGYPSGTSPYGALDMAGNVLDWVNDWYLSNYYSSSPYSNPPGPATGNYKVLRGGGWYTYGGDLRTARRNPGDNPSSGHYVFSFRCGVGAAPGP